MTSDSSLTLEEFENLSRQQIIEMFITDIVGGEKITSENELSHIEDYILEENGELCFGFDFSPKWIDAVCYNGFFPMGDDIARFFNSKQPFYIFLVKHHMERAVLNITKRHFSKKLKNHTENLLFSIDQHFEECVSGILETYPATWLVPPLVDGFRQMFNDGNKTCVKTSEADICTAWTDANVAVACTEPGEITTTVQVTNTCTARTNANVAFTDDSNTSLKTHIHSIEVTDKTTGELVAGEIGFRNGALYSSLSGFKKRNHVGNIQMASLAQFMEEQNIQYWDFGMNLPYKLDLGCDLYTREEFYELHNTLKNAKIDFKCDKRKIEL